jgi:hypothetical protein
VNRLLDECPLEDVSGDYYTLGNRLIGVLSGVGTAIAVVRHGHRWENATTLSTRLSSFPWHAWSAGFVVDYLSPESFTLIGIVPERRIVQCARLESGRFVFSEPVDLNREFDPASEPVCIERTADGHARVTQGARLLARFALAGGPKGRIGLYLERVRPKDDAFVEAQLEFTDVAAR